MADKMLRVNLTELKTARVTCKKCGRGVIEVSTSRLDTALQDASCRFCRHEFFRETDPNPVAADPMNAFRLAFDELVRRADDLGIEFEIPTP